MGITLVVNTGSSSKKYSLYDGGREVLFMTFTRETDEVRCGIRKNGTWLGDEVINDEEYTTSVKRLVAVAQKYGCIATAQSITTAVVRVVSPGSQFNSHQYIDTKYIQALRAMVSSAPLHIPPTVAEIDMLQTVLPEATLVAASDSAFHNTKPIEAARYSIPNVDTEELDIRRFGYHGLSVRSIVRRVHAVTGQNPARVIVAHIGSGVSLTAVRDGLSIDTTMGYAPGSGVVMASRAGDLDAGALLELMRRKSMGVNDAYTYLHTQGGLQGISGEADFRHVLERHAKGEPAAVEAMQVFAYSIRKQLGAMLAALGGADCVVFTATAAERSPVLRSMCLEGLEGLGLCLDKDKNDQHVAREGVISVKDAPVKLVVMKTDEIGEMVRVADNLGS